MKLCKRRLSVCRASSFQRQLLLAFMGFLTAMILIILITVVNFYYFLNNHIMKYGEEIVKQAGVQIDNTLHKLEVSQNQAFGNMIESPLYSNPKQSSATVYATKDLIDSLNTVYRNNDDIENIYAYFLFHDMFYSAISTAERASIREKMFREVSQDDSDNHYEVIIDDNTDMINSIEFYKIGHLVTKKREKAVCMDIILKGTPINTALSSIELGKGQAIYLVNAENQIVYDRQGKYIGKSLDVIKEFENISYNARKTSMQINRNKLVMSYCIDTLNWNLLVTVDYLPLFLQTAGDAFVSMALISITIILLFTYLAVRKSNRLAAPINKFVEHIQRYPNDISFIPEIKNVNSDIKLVVNSYNHLIAKIEALHEQNLKEEKEWLDAEHKALLAQINSHFLFNSLESLRGAALRAKVPELSKTINALSLMLRYSLDEPGKKVTLKKEIQNLEQYLIVIQSRKSFAITVNYDVSEEALECSVIRYMIQPIIENSIHYEIGRAHV